MLQTTQRIRNIHTNLAHSLYQQNSAGKLDEGAMQES